MKLAVLISEFSLVGTEKHKANKAFTNFKALEL